MFIDIRDQEHLEQVYDKWVGAGMTEMVVKNYITSLALHIQFVQEAGRKIGVPEEQMLMHDQSKFSDEEFPAYANNFYGERDPDTWSRAWLHHMNANPHHWQYWIFPDGYSTEGSRVENGVVAMEERYALEMIADWMGAGRAYQGSWDMSQWLKDNMGRIRVHSDTAVYLRAKLSELGYGEIVANGRWAQEVT